MEVYLRIIADTQETVIREVRVKGSTTLLNFQQLALPLFNLSEGEMGSFFYSTEDWDQGDEVPMFSMEGGMPSMENTTVEDFFQGTAHGLYVYNFLDMNIFYVEKTKTEEEEGFEDFVVISTVGELPARESSTPTPAAPGKDPSQMSEAEINALYGLDDLDSEKNSEEEDEDDFQDDPYY